LMIDL